MTEGFSFIGKCPELFLPSPLGAAPLSRYSNPLLFPLGTGNFQNRHSSSMPTCCSTCAGQHEEALALTELVRNPPKSDYKRRTISRNFLVMSDLTREFDRPCVLDLKLGTRQHRDDAPPEKIVSQSLKCARTTSAEMGIRLCGKRENIQ